jgi:Plavaka transposase
MKEASARHLNGVDLPFWRDWHMAEPSTFLNPEPLHHLHKFFWDHETRWCINVLTKPEIDFRFSILQPRIGFRHFKEGITKLKQVTGRVHRDVQRYMIPVIAGGAAPRNFVIAIRALMDFRYLSQAPVIDDEILREEIGAALKEFHDHKAAILETGARRGKKKAIDHFNIPKLELFQTMEASIRSNGANIQWSADVTEHAHIMEIKGPAELGNNQNYEDQICRYLDRLDKIHSFELATSVRSGIGPVSQRLQQLVDSAFVNDPDIDSGQRKSSSTSSPNIGDDTQEQPESSHDIVNYFQEAAVLVHGEHLTAPRPFRTFSAGTSAFRLNRDASYKLMTIDCVAETFGLPDLRPAIMYYLQRCADGEQHIRSIGNRRPGFSPSQLLPFNNVQVWTRVRIQTVSFFPPHRALAPETLEAEPPSTRHPNGKYNSVLVNTDPTFNWPKSGISGEISAMYAGVKH